MGGYVMGDVDGDVDGDVEGYVMGDVDGYVMGDDVVGRRHRRHRRRRVMLPAPPAWRARDAAPGVAMPGEGRELMPLVPDLASGVFDATNNGAIITFSARPQRPFQPIRYITTVRRTANAGVVPSNIVLSDGIFVGTHLSQLQRGAFDIENFSANAFDVKMCLVPCQPGIDVQIPIRLLGAALAGTAQVIVSMLFLGHTIQ